jgi:uncharacterized membrane protein YtjA (UPF0391 family)
MFGWVVTFLVIAIVSGVFGFAGAGGAVGWAARLLFGLVLVLLLVALVAGRRPPTI